MLQKLSIKNYTLIRQAEIDFPSGFIAITGETGAGKSILLGALSLILGRRADLTVLQDKSKKCVIEGTFDLRRLDLHGFFEKNDLDDEKETLLRREILPSGKSRAFVNDTPVGLPLLRQLGDRLVDIHSQHQTLLLNESGFQLELFDAYVNRPDLKKNYTLHFRAFQKSKKKLEALRSQNARAKRDEDYFRFQLNELDSAALDPEEMKQLEEKSRLLSHAVEINSTTAEAIELLKENDYSILEQLGRMKENFAKISDLHPVINGFFERLHSAVIELSDLASEMEHFASLNDFEPSELQQVEERLDTLYALQQKHHVADVEALIALREEYRRKLENISGLEEEVNAEEQKLAELTRKLEDAAAKLQEARKEKMASFEQEVENVLKQLGMKEARFEVVMTPLDHFSPTGKEQLNFTFSANKGGALMPIAKTASGGELSRLMLALKSLIHQAGILPTIIFDEIDAGVSGDIAGKLGAILQKMSKKIQVISITHLPQIAARADHHFKVYKRTDQNNTLSEIVLLKEEQRLEEIAKMLSDEKVTEASRAAAAELLKAGR